MRSFTADASRWSGPPLLKDKFGVYQTPLRSLDTILKSGPLLAEAQVRDIRYEIGIGKPGALAWDQITGRVENLRYDFRTLDALVNSWKQAGIQPLFAFTYCPLPLQSSDGPNAWKSPPRSMSAWESVNDAYAAHLRRMLQVEGSWFEQWNEPDLVQHGQKTFFTGSPEQYRQLFVSGAAGVHEGDPDARVGGPAAAYNLAYLSRAGLLTDPNTDFVSIHAYGNYASQLNRLRSQVMNRPDLPILLTEYASYPTFGLNAPISRHNAAAAFFADVNGLLENQDTPKVYWAQWVDDDLGMVTNDLQRKAIYNAYLLYQTGLPVDRIAVTSDADSAMGAMAGADRHSAAIVVWNRDSRPQRVNLRLVHLRFKRGMVRLWLIDKDHASFLDHAPEMLTPGGDWHEPLRHRAVQWSGLLQPDSVALLRTSDNSGQSLLAAHRIGTFVRSYYWHSHSSEDTSYADFDPRTSIARLGLGTTGRGLAKIGNVYEDPADELRVQVKMQGRLVTEGKDSLFGIRIDFENQPGKYDHSVLFCNRMCGSVERETLALVEQTARPDRIVHERRMESGHAFTIRLASFAPKNWDRRRIVITPILQDASSSQSARIRFVPIGNAPGN